MSIPVDSQRIRELLNQLTAIRDEAEIRSTREIALLSSARRGSFGEGESPSDRVSSAAVRYVSDLLRVR